MRTVVVLFYVASVWAVSASQGPQRVVGGEVTTIDQHPYIAAMLVFDRSINTFFQNCGGTILNERTILSAAHCYVREPNPSNWRVRVGSTFRHSGGVVHNVSQIFNHPLYDSREYDHDISVIHLATSIVFNAFARPAQIPAPEYRLLDNEPIWSVGWGQTSYDGIPSEQLKHVHMHVTNQETCKSIHNITITSTMLCFSADTPGQGTCQQDSGGPNIHHSWGNNVVVGVTAFGIRCGEADEIPDVTIRVTEYFDWILEHALTEL